MICARIYNIAVTSVYNGSFDRTHVLYYTTLPWIVNQFRRFAPPPYIPRAEARGFTAGLVMRALRHEHLSGAQSPVAWASFLFAMILLTFQWLRPLF
jgi:hypothetical protein